MRRTLWALLCVLSSMMARADSTKDAVNAFQGSVAKSQLILRNFSGEDKVHGRWNGTELELDAPRWRTLGVFVVDAVQLKGQKLTLRCTRHVMVKDKTDKVVLYGQADSVEIEVDINGTDPNLILPRLKTELFYPSIRSGLAALPHDLQNVLPAPIDEAPPRDSAKAPKSTCDCALKDTSGCGNDTHAPGMVPPRYLRGHVPEFSDQARAAKLNGRVNVRLRIDKEGHPTDVWVAVPLGMGLDEAAAKSVLTYVFKPATCDGIPVGVFMAVDVRFQIR